MELFMKGAPAERLPVLLLSGLLLLSGCASGPEVTRISKLPGASEAPASLLVLAVSNKEKVREVTERVLVSRLQKAGYQAASYGPAPELPWQDPVGLRDKVKERLKSSPADGVLTVSLVRKNRQIEHVPNQVVLNPVTVNMGSLASTTYMETINIPAHVEETTEYILRTTLFDVDLGQPIWQMYSSTVDPSSLDQASESFARVVVRELDNSFP
ncbi:MAG: hypothetical protein ACQEV6_07760 [Pseudomonadota bacterium]